MKNLILISSLFLLALSAACSKTSSSTEKISSDSSRVQGTIHISRADFLAKVVNFQSNPDEFKYLGDKPCIVDFYATWCGPCKMVSPILEELAKEYAGKIYIYKVDTDKEPQLSSELRIQSIPTFIFCPMNEKPFGSAGTAGTAAETKAQFKKIIEEQLLKKQANL
jgi:thioredoxin